MSLNLFYTMVQKSQKWPKTQIKGGGPALRPLPILFTSDSATGPAIGLLKILSVILSVSKRNCAQPPPSHIKPVTFGSKLRTYMIPNVHTELPPSPDILWTERGGKPKRLSLNYWYEM